MAVVSRVDSVVSFLSCFPFLETPGSDSCAVLSSSVLSYLSWRTLYCLAVLLEVFVDT